MKLSAALRGVGVYTAVAAGAVVPSVEVESLDGTVKPVAAMESTVTRIMDKAGVPGLSLAIINGSEIVYAGGFGVRNTSGGEPVDAETIFAAASFSKTVFAYIVMLLVDEGVIDLDEPLYRYLDKPLPQYARYADLEGDDRYKQVTARIVLSHTTGFPNWRFLTEDRRLAFFWSPGRRFGYSGEGIELLQMVVEEVTGEGLEELARSRVFGPLGMTRTGYVWHDWFGDNFANPHDGYGRSKRFRRRMEADAAGSMATTAGDYARLLVAMLRTDEMRRETVDEMLRPQIQIRSSTMFGPGARSDTGDYEDMNLSWGLGWGRFDCVHGRAFFHTGHGGGVQNYNVTFPDRGIGVVFLSNSDNFESVARELAEATIGDVYSPFDWLGYPYYDPQRNREPPPPPVAIEVDPSILKTYTGKYDLGGERFIYVEYRKGTLQVSTDGQQWSALLPETTTLFFVEDEDMRLEFIKGEDDRVREMLLKVEGLELHAPICQ